jgi:serpin B
MNKMHDLLWKRCFRIFLSLISFLPCLGHAEENQNATVQANNRFALEFYGTLPKESNLFFSPYSIYSALTMTYPGAAGNTQREMQQVLHLPQNSDEAVTSLAALNEQLKSEQLHLANAFWVQSDLKLSPQFEGIMKRSFPNAFQLANFMRAPDQARNTINKWVADQTKNKIQGLLQSNDVTSTTRMVLVSAIYMQAAWNRPFKPLLTQSGPFYLPIGKSVQMSFMNQKALFPYASFDTYSVVELPYASRDKGNLVMQILLPHRVDGLKQLEQAMDSALIDKIDQELTQQTVALFLPKMNLTNSIDLKEPLQRLGMRDAFGMQADFSNIAGARDLAIDKAIHKTFIRVDEEGTEAAAATAISIGLTSMLPSKQIVEFRADHPFVFIIKEKDSGTILFIGRMTE